MKNGLLIAATLSASLTACNLDTGGAATDVNVESLERLSVESLRGRTYDSSIEILGPVAAVTALDTCQGMFGFDSMMFGYESDGLRLFARLDIPRGQAPDEGYPVAVYVHAAATGDAVRAFDFDFQCESVSGRAIRALTEAGFAVVSPGLRGHGTVEGVAAGGIEFVEAWDNGSYVIPVFYAIDVLNLASGLRTLNLQDWAKLMPERGARPTFDVTGFDMLAYSRGGDVALMALGISGEQSLAGNFFDAASIISGTFADRLAQLASLYPMESTSQAFLGGDGTWTGSATGRDGSENPNFVFGWPPDRIETPDVSSWTWQHDTWQLPDVGVAMALKLDEMYNAILDHADDINIAYYELSEADNGQFLVLHDERIVEAVSYVGASNSPEFLAESISLHHSDRDYRSTLAWNEALCNGINEAGGSCFDFVYPGTTHTLGISDRAWFSPVGTEAGLDTALRRSIDLFSGLEPE